VAKQWKTEEELNEPINLLIHRINSLQAKSLISDIEVDSVNIAVQESAFRNTVREIFGEDSNEFAEFGQTEMLYEPLRSGISSVEIVQARLRGREYMVKICVELISRLQQKIHAIRRKMDTGTVSPPELNALHPSIKQAIENLVANGHSWEAVFAASKALVLYVKDKSNRSDLDGIALMRTVFSKNNPVLKFNPLLTQTDLDEQEGMMHLFEGAVMTLRNPGAHGFPSGSDKRANQYINLLSLLAFRTDEATK
jgi:uncharacterized protein (TIGR02391 family)